MQLSMSVEVSMREGSVETSGMLCVLIGAGEKSDEGSNAPIDENCGRVEVSAKHQKLPADIYEVS